MTLLWCGGPVTNARAGSAVKAQIRIAEGLDRVDGVASVTVTNTSSATFTSVPLWAFPNRLARPNPAFNEVNLDWIFPSRFSPGGMTIHKVVSGGASLRTEPRASSGGALVDVHLASPLRPGEGVTLEVSFQTRIPHRFGPFGHTNDQLTLDGGFIPRPPPLGPAGFASDAPPDEVDYAIRARLLGSAGGPAALVALNGRITRLPADGHHHSLGSGRARRLTLTLHTRHEVSTLRVDDTFIALFHRRRRRRVPVTGAGVRDLTAIDTHAQTLASIGSGVAHFNRLATSLGLPQRAPRRLVAVECSLRRDIAIGAPNMLLISDRAFELLEVERLRKFQRRAMIRQLYRQLLEPTLGRRHPLEVRDRVVDMVALHSAERWEKEVYGAADSAQQLLSGGSFVALVDEALYAPQLPFQNVYFASIDDTDALRDRFTLFSHKGSNGRRWLEKLRDRADKPSELDNAIDALLKGDDLGRALEPVSSLADLRQWDGAIPAMNYVLESVQKGTDSAGHYADVTVRREGAQVREPVRVRAVDEAGGAAEETWDGHTRSGTVRVRTARPVDRVLLDPYSRLFERDLGHNIDPRRDNRDYDEWKFLIEGFRLSFSSVANRVEGVLITLLQPGNDLTHLFSFEPYYLANRAGLFAGYFHFFGDKIRPNRRRYNISTSLRAEWLRGNDVDRDGLGLQLAVGFGDADKLSRINPSKSHRLYASVAASMAWQQAAADLSGSVRLGYARVASPLDGHKLGFKLEASSLFGTPSPQQEYALGGADAVRAFDPLARTGRHRVLLMAEWRHRMTRDLMMNVAQLGFVTQIEGVLFVDAALLSKSYEDFFSARSVYLGVGYGLRFFYLLFGMNPMLVRIDVAYPLFAGTPPKTPSPFPLSFVLSIDQAF